MLSVSVVSGCGVIQSDASVDIERPVETTWTVFADADRREAWLHDWHGLPWADSDPAAIGEPTTVELRDDEDVMILMQTIRAIEPNETFAFDLGHAWADVENVVSFEPRGPNACTVRWRAAIRPHGFWRGVSMHLARGSIDARFAEHLSKLKTVVEAEPGGRTDISSP